MVNNLYANKISKESPSGIWTLDDDLSITPTALPDSINLDGLYGIEADAYGFDSNYGYYISTTSSASDVLAFNDAIPMVFGATNSTTLYSGEGTPSLIIPGKGFMHDYGKNKNITVEFWTKIYCNDNVLEKRIFGPINSTDGLYVSGPFLTLKFGNAVKSHYIGEWGRPMLVTISYNSEKILMSINGSPVTLLEFDIDLSTPNTEPEDNWLAFFAYDDIPVISIDCIAIYPYNVSSKQSKLHFVYGQALEEPESKNAETNELPVIIDYQMSGTAGNHNYPDHSVWSDGYLKNMSINNKQLSSPSFEIPTISFDDKTIQESDWLYTNKINNQILDPTKSNMFLRLKPQEYTDPASGDTELTSLYWTNNSHFLIQDFKIGSKRADAFYLTGRADRFIDSATETIVDILDQLNNVFSIKIEYPASGGTNATVRYYYNGSVFDNTLSFTVTASQMFSIGLDIKNFTDSVDNEEIEEFFSDPESLNVYFGGSYNYSSTFSGRVYSFGFLSSSDIGQIEGVTSDNSIFPDGVLNGSVETLQSFVGGFSVRPTMTFDVYDVDVSSNGYWSDIIPLKILSKEVGGDYIIDYIQLNVDFPDFINTQNNVIRSYVTFLNVDETSTMQTTATDVAIPSNGFISTTDWATKRYEFVSGNILEVPLAGSTDSELSIKIELEIKNIDISRNPIKLRRVEISSRAFDEVEVVGTKSGKNLSILGNNSFVRLHKKSSPYLYLSKNSGIKLINSSNTYDGSSYIKVAINESFSENYFVSAIQFAFRSNFEFTNTTSYSLAKLRLADGSTYYVSLVGTPNGRARIVTDITTIDGYSDAKFLINGKETDISSYSPELALINPYDWNMVTLSFTQPLNFGSLDTSADIAIRLDGNFSYDNVSTYQVPDQKLSQVVIYDTWSEYDEEYRWDNLDEDNNPATTPAGTVTWENIAIEAVLPGGNISIDAQTVYLSYIGGLRLSNDPDGTVLRLPSSKWKSYNGYSEIKSVYIPL